MDRLIVHPDKDRQLTEPPLDPKLAAWVIEAATMANLCKEFGGLPRAGGMLEQPAGLMRRMLLVTRYEEAVRMYEQHDDGSGPLPSNVQDMVRWGVDTRLVRAMRWAAQQEEAVNVG